MEKESLIPDLEDSIHNSNLSGLEIEHKLKLDSQIIHLDKKKRKRRKKSEPTTTFGRFISYVDRFYMIWMLCIVIPLAAIFQWGHNDGPLHPQISSSWVVTILLFFGIGLLIKIEYLQRAIYFWQMIIFAHAIIFLYWPVLGWIIYQIGAAMPDKYVSDTLLIFLQGITILCCLPATASSATVFTMNVNANEAASAVNCTCSNLLAIFVTPGLILLFTGGETKIDAANLFMTLSLRVVAPFIVAQIIRCGIGKKGRKKIKSWKHIVKKFNETAILYMVFCALSQSFYVGIDASVTDAVVFFVLIEVLHVHAYFMIYLFGALFEKCLGDEQLTFTIKDNVAIMYTGVSKSIAMGVPFIEMIYADDPYVGFYLLPILCYHPSNLIWGSIFSEPLRNLINRNLSKYSMLSCTTMTTIEVLDPDYSPEPRSASNDHPTWQASSGLSYGTWQAYMASEQNITPAPSTGRAAGQ